MFGPFTALLKNSQQTIQYNGNRIFKPIKDIKKMKIRSRKIQEIISNRRYWTAIQNINNTIFFETCEFFKKLKAKFVALPLITRMISSPGAALIDILKLKGKAKKIALETIPVALRWFNLDSPVFLAESSQLYLEIALIQEKVNQVFSIYNSFRKEKADATHLCEFHHIEYEGQVTQEENIKIIKKLLSSLIKALLERNEEELRYFLSKDDLEDLYFLTKRNAFAQITLKEALNLLYENTGNKKYLKFTSLNFGAWEEVKITEILGGKFVIVSEYPLEEIPFYQAPKEPKDNENKKIIKLNKKKSILAKIVDGRIVGNNSDIIFPGYREVVGSGHRVRSAEEAEWQIKNLLCNLLNLPKNEVSKIMKWYEPYIEIRKSPFYKETSGFGLGWERLLQGILRTPTIIDVTPFPRVHFSISP